MKKLISIVIKVTFPLLLTACTSGQFIKSNTQPYSPNHYRLDEEFETLRKKISGLPRCESLKTATCYNKDDRDQLLTLGISTINKNYKEYIDGATLNRASRSFGSDSLALLFSTVSTIINPISSKSVFSGLSATTLGSKTAYEKSFFQDVSFFVIASKMDQTRLTMVNQLLTKLGDSLDDYPIYNVVPDLDIYYEAGSTLSSLGEAYKDSILKAKEEVEKTTKAAEYEADIKKQMEKFVTTETINSMVQAKADTIRDEVVKSVQQRINAAVQEAVELKIAPVQQQNVPQ